jgi:alkanesulfonate monooxygenase SsuD/methylene tetrahydromethanopterin reductase-like flavin-dependent oxidoreductase (luciferase family)
VQAVAWNDDPDPSRSVIRTGKLCDELGYDAFFIGDHPGYQTEPFLHLGAIAAQTSRIRLGSVVNCVYHRHPVMHARLTADLDRISSGRVILGLGIGWNEGEFAQLGIPFPSVPERQAALDEAIEIINGVWGPEPFTFAGKHWWTERGHVLPRPLQEPSVPLMIAGAGERVTLRQVAQYADACNFGSGRNVGRVKEAADFRRKFDILRAHCDRLGRSYDAILRSHFTTWLVVRRTAEEAAARWRHYYPNGMTEDQRATRIGGSPEQITAYFQELADAGMQYFVVQILDAADEETMHLLATEVMPNIYPSGH